MPIAYYLQLSRWEQNDHFRLKGVVMCQQPRAFSFLCQISSHYLFYLHSKTLAYGKKRFLVKMSLIRMGSYVPAFILGYLFVNHDFSFGALIWKASKTYNDLKFCKELKR